MLGEGPDDGGAEELGGEEGPGGAEDAEAGYQAIVHEGAQEDREEHDEAESAGAAGLEETDGGEVGDAGNDGGQRERRDDLHPLFVGGTDQQPGDVVA